MAARLREAAGSVRYPVERGEARPLAVAEPAPEGASRPRLLDRVRDALRACHSSRRTEKSYVAWIRPYIVFQGERHPAEMGAVELTLFLSSLAQQDHVAASTQNQALSALLFLRLAAGCTGSSIRQRPARCDDRGPQIDELQGRRRSLQQRRAQRPELPVRRPPEVIRVGLDPLDLRRGVSRIDRT